jgi:hypothetical protein
VVVLALVLGACGDDTEPAPRQQPMPTQRQPAADPAAGITTPLDGVAPQYDAAVLAELSGDTAAARTGYEKLLAAADAPAPLAARAALHLAQLEARAGKNRHALDLGARAAALAPSDVAIADGIAQLRADVVAAAGAGDFRGPPAGTALPGVEPQVADQFAAAERALAEVHARRPHLVIEALSASISAQEAAYESVAARYRMVREHGGLAQLASDYRIGSLYHDLGLVLLFEPIPPELEATFAAGLRRVLRATAISYLKKAIAAYDECLAAPTPEGELSLWRLAAETDRRAAGDVLDAAGEGSPR